MPAFSPRHFLDDDASMTYSFLQDDLVRASSVVPPNPTMMSKSPRDELANRARSLSVLRPCDG